MRYVPFQIVPIRSANGADLEMLAAVMTTST